MYTCGVKEEEDTIERDSDRCDHTNDVDIDHTSIDHLSISRIDCLQVCRYTHKIDRSIPNNKEIIAMKM